MSIQKTITLTEKGAKAGPNFNIYYSADGITYTLLETVILNGRGAFVVITIPDNTALIKLTSLGNCTNSVIHEIVSLGDFNPIEFDKLDFN
jgi:hypothetical protein